MQNFVYHNPTKLVFGKGTIAQLSDLVPTGLKVLMTYGGGSIKRNGVYDQVKAALKGRDLIEFGGIEPNPRYETLMKAVEVCRREKVEFLLAVGGGSVLDGTKFIAVAAFYEAGDPWDILAKNAKPTRALPIGCVLTLPATGSESNPIAVISREATREKLAFSTPLVYPTFSIIDPETHYSLPRRQVQNGIADAFVHVMEQYLTYPADAPVQDRLAEGIARTLIEYGPKVLRQPRNYNARAAIALCSTLALNGLIGCGVPQDWTTHLIGHELTAFYGLDHAQTLVILLPAVWRHQKRAKRKKLEQYAERVWEVKRAKDKAEAAIRKTEEFFRTGLGMKTRLSECGVGTERFEEIAARIEARGLRLGEHKSIGRKEIVEILKLSL
ncbi:MAG: iron-containing alcohol dehydrogenase [Verrucomicrobiae bacterium]|nr:iron-containing alcohol dehydrogenase [Verrucomicrobiae bacterium]MDW7979412.1 iron-containing alcohol dehydrogenase [Verrucomicrobiales bacterium]